MSKYLNYLLIVLGAVITIYARAEANQNQYILIGGIIILMLGAYRISRNIPRKIQDKDVEGEEKNGTV